MKVSKSLTEKVAKGQYTFLSPWWDEISKPAQDLVSHLLTVDPEKRYSIEQFLQHPWIRQSDEATHAAADAPPLATPAYQRNAQLGMPATGVDQETATPNYNASLAPSILDTPGGNRRVDFRSPGAVNLREVFDVSYAVHRQEEESKRRKNFPQGYRGAAGINGLNPLDENDYDEESQDGQYESSKLPKPREADVSGVEQTLRNTNLAGQVPSAAAQARAQAAPAARGYGQHSPAVAAAAKQNAQQRQGRGPFELSLDNATLLGRRGKGGEPKGGSKLREQVVQ